MLAAGLPAVVIAPQTLHAATPGAPAQAKYVFKNVVIEGGGFVDGIIAHPTIPGLMYARTDCRSSSAATTTAAPAASDSPSIPMIPNSYTSVRATTACGKAKTPLRPGRK